jgi:hypothetical protein
LVDGKVAEGTVDPMTAKWGGECPCSSECRRSSRSDEGRLTEPKAGARISATGTALHAPQPTVQHGVRQHPLQPAVLILQRLQPLRLRHFQPAEPGFPFVEDRRADAVLAANLRRRNPGLLLPQYRNNLLFREP